MKNDDIYLVHNRYSDIIQIRERDKTEFEDIVLRRLDLYPANLNDLVQLNILMDINDFYYELYNTGEFDDKTGTFIFRLKLVGDVILENRYADQAARILKSIKEKEAKENDSKINQQSRNMDSES